METLLLQRYNTKIAISQYDNVTNRCCDQDMRTGPSELGGPRGPWPPHFFWKLVNKGSLAPHFFEGTVMLCRYT